MQMTLNILGEKVEDLFRVLRIRISVFLIVTLRFFTVCLMPDSVDKKSNSVRQRDWKALEKQMQYAGACLLKANVCISSTTGDIFEQVAFQIDGCTST